MKIISKLLLSSVLLCSSSFSQVIPDKAMAEDNLNGTIEFQFFVSKTRNVDTQGLKSKVVFQGEMEDYYTFYQPRMEQSSKSMIRDNVTEVGLKTASGGLQNSIEKGFAGSDINGFLASAGIGVIVSSVFNTFDTDDTYISIEDFFNAEGTPVTRITKMIVSEDTIDEEELDSIFASSDDQSFHYRQAFITEITEENQL